MKRVLGLRIEGHFETFKEHPGYTHVICHNAPIFVGGASEEEALERLRDTVGLYMRTLSEHGRLMDAMKEGLVPLERQALGRECEQATRRARPRRLCGAAGRYRLLGRPSSETAWTSSSSNTPAATRASTGTRRRRQGAGISIQGQPPIPRE